MRQALFWVLGMHQGSTLMKVPLSWRTDSCVPMCDSENVFRKVYVSYHVLHIQRHSVEPKYDPAVERYNILFPDLHHKTITCYKTCCPSSGESYLCEPFTEYQFLRNAMLGRGGPQHSFLLRQSALWFPVTFQKRCHLRGLRFGKAQIQARLHSQVSLKREAVPISEVGGGLHVLTHSSR